MVYINEKKTVIIVGGSFGGRLIAKGLLDINDQNFEIKIVDKAAHFEFICGNYKTLCDDDCFKKLAESHSNGVKSLNTSDIKHPVQFI